MKSSMTRYKTYADKLRLDLKAISTDEKAEASRRYFPGGVNCIGASASDIKSIVSNFISRHSELTASGALSIAEYLLQNSQYNEENLVAFAMINKFVKHNYEDNLLDRFEFWLEHYADNWSQVDDLCIKTIYLFLMARPHLIEKTQHWAYSEVSWCRRASNVVWVKFIKRKISKSTYCLDTRLVFKNCDVLLDDKDVFVQKSIGWLLKVTSQQHEREVIEYISNNFAKMTRPTIRYAIEKMDKKTRKSLLARTRVNSESLITS